MFLDKIFDREAAMDKMNTLVTEALAKTKLNELLHKEEVKAEPEKKSHPVIIALAIIGAVAAVAGIAYCVYRFVCPEYLEEFVDDELEDEVQVNAETRTNAISYEELKQRAKEERKVKNRISFLEKEIERLEAEMKKIEAVLSNPKEGDDIMELTRSYLEDKRELDAKTEEWGSLI